MRHSRRLHAAAGLCALMGLIAHAGASQLTAVAQGNLRGNGPGATATGASAGGAGQAAAARCAASPCGAGAWPYAPEVAAAEANGSSRPARRVRVIALDAAPSSR